MIDKQLVTIDQKNVASNKKKIKLIAIEDKNGNNSNNNNNEIKFADWFNVHLSNKMNKPLHDNYKLDNSIKIGFGSSTFESKFCRHFVYNNKTNLFNFQKFVPIQPPHDVTNIKKISTKISKLDPNLKCNKTKIKSLQTKKANTEYKSNNIMKTVQIEIFPTDDQKIIINSWIKSAEKCYNKCVDLYNNDNKYFINGYKKAKLDIFKILYGKNEKDCPYDILTDEVRKFCSNLKSCSTNLEEKNIKKFTLHYLNKYRDQYNIFIPKNAINKKSIYGSHLGKIKGLENLSKIECDCRLLYSKKKNKYWVCVPTIVKRKVIDTKRESVVGIDEGEVIFVTYHGENSFGEIGKGMRQIILKELGKIERMQKILARRKNRKGHKIKNRRSLQIKIQGIYNKIKNIVKELHNKTALFLCKRYERVMLPKFETQKMVMKRKYTKTYYNKIKEEKGEEEMRKQLRETTKRRRLQKKVKKVLNMLSHYRFKQHLINKGNEYGCVIDTEATENETTMTCTYCENKEYTLEKRIRKCKECNIKIDRDWNASRSVIIKNTKKEEIEV